MKHLIQYTSLILFLSNMSLLGAQQHVNLPSFAGGDKSLPIESRTIQGAPIEGYWVEPAQYEVSIYEKVEWCVVLPEKLQMSISEFFKKNGTSKNGINPYDPDQIDVWAEIWTPGQSAAVRVNGFFFQDIQRMTEGEVNSWTWKEKITTHPFRIRYAPRSAGIHHVKFFISTASKGKYETRAFSFNTVANGASGGFVGISPNGRYYQLDNGDPFFPVGQNFLTAQTCGCEKTTEGDDTGWNNTNCETCYDTGSDNPCCGLKADRKKSFWQPPTKDIRNMVEHPAAFVKMLENIVQFKAAGGNAYRTILTPISYDFEFEKLNNYQDRQFMAWEFDQLLTKSSELGLKIELCMLIHGQFTNSFTANWDWTDFDRWNEGYGGYCYYTERTKTNCDTEPASFFAQEEAKKYYKKKLRYFFARYGYSNAIYQLELLSEANNVGTREEHSKSPDEWWGWVYSQIPPSRSYNLSAQTRYDVGQWTDQMAKYIKEDLQQDHVIACSYTGTAMFNEKFKKGAPDCDDPLLDIAQMSPYIDVIAHSSYDPAFDRWKKWSDHDNTFNCEWYRLQCPEARASGKRKFLGYPSIDRPYVHSENGNDLAINTDQQWFEKDLWCNAFSGHASSGMAWGIMRPHERWKMYSNVNRYMKEIIFPMTDLMTDTTWSVDWSEGRGKTPSARRMEMVYMKNSTPGKQCAFGILMNRTWNPATSPPEQLSEKDRTAFVDAWTPQFKNGVDNVSFMPFVEIPYKYSLAPMIEDMGTCNSFEITYYNPYTLQILQRSDDDVIMGKGVLLKYYPALSKDLPYVLFTIVRNGNCITK